MHPVVAQSQRDRVWGRAFKNSRLLYITLLALPGNKFSPVHSTAAFSHTCHQCLISNSISLLCAMPFCSSIFPTSLLYICSLKWHCKLQCVTQYIFPQTALHASTHSKVSLVWFKASGFWSTVNTGLSLRLALDILLLLRVRVVLWLGWVSEDRIQMSSRPPHMEAHWAWLPCL